MADAYFDIDMGMDNTGESMNLINWKCIVLKNHRCNWLKLRTEEASREMDTYS